MSRVQIGRPARSIRWGSVAAVVALCACSGRSLMPDTTNPPRGGAGGYPGGTGGSGRGGSDGAPNPIVGGLGGAFEPYPPICAQITTVPGAFNPCGRADSLAYSPDGTLLAMGAERGRPNVHLYRLSDGMLVRNIDGTGQVTFAVAFSPDGRTLATAGGTGTGDASVTPDIVKLWDVATGALVRTLPATCGFYADTVAFSPDGSLLATAGYAGAIEIWRVADGTLVASIPYPTSVQNVHFSPTGSQLIASGVDGRATIWNVPAGTLARTLAGIGNRDADAAFSPEGKLIASTAPDYSIQLWDATNGALIQGPSQGSHTNISHIVWVDQDRFLTNDWNGTILSWTHPSDSIYFNYSVVRMNGGQSVGIAVSPDRKTVVAGGYVLDPQSVDGFTFHDL